MRQKKVRRNVDEFAPRAVLRQLFSENKIGIKDHTVMEQFLDKYCVVHLEEQRTAALIRSREKQLNKQQRKSKSCVDYNWKQLVRDVTLRSLTINELKNYIDYHKLSKTGKKSNWLERIFAHFYLSSATENQQNPSALQQDNETDSTETDDETSENEDYMDADDSADDEFLAVGLEGENNDKIMIPETVYTWSGRKTDAFSTVSDLFRGKSSDAIP